MTQFDSHANFALSLVATAPSPATSGTSLTLTTGDVVAQKFPTTGSFNAVAWPSSKPSWATAEIVRCTWSSGDTFTIVRQQETSSAQSIAIGWSFMLSDSAKIFTDIESAVNSLATQFLAADGGSASSVYTGAAKIDLGSSA